MRDNEMRYKCDKCEYLTHRPGRLKEHIEVKHLNIGKYTFSFYGWVGMLIFCFLVFHTYLYLWIFLWILTFICIYQYLCELAYIYYLAQKPIFKWVASLSANKSLNHLLSLNLWLTQSMTGCTRIGWNKIRISQETLKTLR